MYKTKKENLLCSMSILSLLIRAPASDITFKSIFNGDSTLKWHIKLKQSKSE